MANAYSKVKNIKARNSKIYADIFHLERWKTFCNAHKG